MAHKSGLTKRTVRVLFFGTLLILAASFWYFSPFTYGLYGPIKGYDHLRWIRTWDY
jgi:dolichyl-phosphate-mannose--protein O-mannosyl transferase